jgi:hypothetical protein
VQKRIGGRNMTAVVLARNPLNLDPGRNIRVRLGTGFWGTVAFACALALLLFHFRQGSALTAGISVKFADVKYVEANMLRVTDEGISRVSTSFQARGEVR